jgi:hypothetical protein
MQGKPNIKLLCLYKLTLSQTSDGGTQWTIINTVNHIGQGLYLFYLHVLMVCLTTLSIAQSAEHRTVRRSVNNELRKIQNKLVLICLGSALPTAVVLRSSIFWNTTPYDPLKVNRRFIRIYRFHHQGRRITQARSQHEADSKFASCFIETSVDFQWTTRRHTPEDKLLR